MIKKPIFWDYITVNNDGDMSGIIKDAPEEIKESYRRY